MKQRKTLSYSKNREKKRHYHRNIEVSFQEEPKKGNKRRKEEWKKTWWAKSSRNVWLASHSNSQHRSTKNIE